MLTIIGFVLVGLAFLNIASNRQLARYFGGFAKSLNRSLVRQSVVLFGMMAFIAGVTAIVLSHI